MAQSRRPLRAGPRKGKRRVGTVLFLVGILTVLVGTFVAGALAGRLSLRPSASVANASKSGERAVKPPALPPPQLTFYRELTAPLTPLPSPQKPAARSATKKEGHGSTTDGKTNGAPVESLPDAEAGRYTVQVGSYSVRAQAEALRARLAAAGHAAYLAEGEAGGVTRYRVRVGAFPTLEDARGAAVQLGSREKVATYVTTR